VPELARARTWSPVAARCVMPARPGIWVGVATSPVAYGSTVKLRYSAADPTGFGDHRVQRPLMPNGQGIRGSGAHDVMATAVVPARWRGWGTQPPQDGGKGTQPSYRPQTPVAGGACEAGEDSPAADRPHRPEVRARSKFAWPAARSKADSGRGAGQELRNLL